MVDPVDTDIDALGNVYAIGYKRIGANPPSVVVTKFASGGAFAWVHEFRNPNGEYDPRIEVTDTGEVYVAMTHPVSKNYTMLARLNPVNGGVAWQRYVLADVTYDLKVRETSPRRILVVTHDRSVSPFKIHAIAFDDAGTQIGQHWTIPPTNSWLVTDFEMTSNGNFVYLMGGDIGLYDPQSTRLVFMSPDGVLLRQVSLGAGRFIATTAAAGGKVYTVGASTATTLSITCVNNFGSLFSSRTDTSFGVIGVTLSDALADETGSLFVSGTRKITSTVSAPLCIRYSYPGMTPLWRLTSGLDATELRFEGMERDRFGMLYASSVSNAAGYRVYGIDRLTGRIVGRADNDTAAAFTAPFDAMAINSSGVLSHAVPFTSGTDEGMLLQKIQGVNLKTISLPSTNVVGGTTVQGTVSMYLPLPYARTVTLASNSPYATVPSTVQIPANAASATFTVTTTSPFGVAGVTIIADDGSARRTFSFLVWQ